MLEHQIPPHLKPIRPKTVSAEERKAKILLGIIKLKRYHELSHEALEQVMKMACELSK
ncbi:hypothetical protein [Xenorhabdus szentirmaii]|uniref:Uncharacterized protein n=1 Tax=Xenorhabdus szentirmaii DSM 16338 TaxID=1427518 RepID=W1J270_9GAMM|nr:hypothetical protein [Xenorhabdus szentirmaii]PHM32123.1 hypothetical protein Xsze_02853 [Xenorhabdus szentirmaii DSM 16338]PHM41585.1 hypothetical protein Xszus_01278 [Xenorhabdus szentirmaii]CDL84857.1 hypothetical protein XSR1_550008 [Xenorhabdus szentirmaii DSM 16338]